MTLSLGLSSARTSLLVTGDQTSLISRNIANADTPYYSRKSAEVVTVQGSGVRIAQVKRAEQPALLRAVLQSNSDASTQRAKLESLDELNTTINDVELDASPAALLAKFSGAMQAYASQPQSQLAGEAAVRTAVNLSNALNSASAVVQSVRREADAGIEAAIERTNTILSEFDQINTKIVKGTKAGSDVTDLLDTRDQLLGELSEFMGIRTVERTDNDMVIYTDSGVTLFERSPRELLFTASASLTPGAEGGAVFIDGVPVTGSNATMPLQAGRIVGLAAARDDISISYQRQLDEIARTLITTFAETDQTGGAAPDAPGLFTYTGGSTIPAAGTVVDGLAASIRVNANVDPAQGGLATRLRDGGIANPSIANYVYNSTGAASYTDRLDQLVVALTDTVSFDSGAGLSTSANLSDYSSSSVAWLQEARKNADSEFEYRDTLNKRASESHSKMTGVNLDEEMSTLLELERSYQTTSKLISVIDSMFNALVSAL